MRVGQLATAACSALRNAVRLRRLLRAEGHAMDIMNPVSPKIGLEK
jgi:hypothetical protein